MKKEQVENNPQIKHIDLTPYFVQNDLECKPGKWDPSGLHSCIWSRLGKD